MNKPFLDAEAVPFIVRSKGLTKEAYQNLVASISELQDEMEFDFLIHHHWQLFADSGALGVHLTAQSDSVKTVREALGPEAVIGYSAHSAEEAIQAKRDGADYILLGSIFPTASHDDDHPVLGLAPLKEASRKCECPIYAIGGVNTGNLELIKNAGAAGFASLTAVYENGEIEHNVSKLMFLWED